MQQVRAAEHYRKGASAEHFPTIDLTGRLWRPGSQLRKFSRNLTGRGPAEHPYLSGRQSPRRRAASRSHARQARARLDNLRGQIEYEVRTALLDLAAADEQVQVARSSVDLAEQTLTQARDRFSAGVTDNLEVVAGAGDRSRSP